jgi:murein L,D-transpeptidase YafK
MKIVVYKSKNILEVWKNEKLVKSYTVATGKGGAGHKYLEGDLITPEGEYKVVVKNPKSKYHLSFGVNFPNNNDAKRGLDKGLLTEEEFNEICKLNAEGKIPLWKTKMGGEIYIHGHLENQNWTHGCVRMLNPDIEELYAQVNIGDIVVIKN